ncbi:MAG: hypothetical protein ACFFB5_03875 [Promethearchaeota archaeon]
MIENTIERIKKTLPEVEHVVMFYNDGTVFHTTFERPVNIPKLGENFSETLISMQKMYEICNFDLEGFNKLVFDTDGINVIILKLGENSNLALFFRKKKKAGELKIRSIRRYIELAENLLDVDRVELVEQELESKEGQLIELKLQLGSQQYKLFTLEEFQTETEDEEKKKEVTKEIEKVSRDVLRVKEAIDKKIDEITNLKGEIEREKATKGSD